MKGFPEGFKGSPVNLIGSPGRQFSGGPPKWPQGFPEGAPQKESLTKGKFPTGLKFFLRKLKDFLEDAKK